MTASETFRVRLDSDLAKKMRRWAKNHDTDLSEAMRVAFKKLVEEEDVERRVKATLRELDELASRGAFDPPKGPWKAGGFR